MILSFKKTSFLASHFGTLSTISSALLLLLASTAMFGQTDSTPPQTIIHTGKEPMLLDASSGKVVRGSKDTMNLGFNVPWNAVQGMVSAPGSGIWDASEQSVWPSVLEFLKEHFAGSIYRYPGGTVSNTFNWKESLGPLENRSLQQIASWTPPEKAFFGLDEFLRFLGQVNGQALITVNLSTMTPQDAADLVEYLNAPADDAHPWAQKRAASTVLNHPEPYGVKLWELGNELDMAKDVETVEKYNELIASFAQAMRKVDPDIKIITHASTGPKLAKPSWPEWHRQSLAVNGDLIDGISFHTYYIRNGLSVESMDTRFINTVVNDSAPRPVYITEHAIGINFRKKDQSEWPETTAITGAVATCDMILAMTSQRPVALLQWHALGGTGPWRPFNGTGADGEYDSRFEVRPVMYGMALLNRCLDGKDVLETVVSTASVAPEPASYTGMRGVLLRDPKSGQLSLAIASYARESKRIQVILPSPEAYKEATLAWVDAASSGIQEKTISLTPISSNSFEFELPAYCVAVLDGWK